MQRAANERRISCGTAGRGTDDTLECCTTLSFALFEILHHRFPLVLLRVVPPLLHIDPRQDRQRDDQHHADQPEAVPDLAISVSASLCSGS